MIKKIVPIIILSFCAIVFGVPIALAQIPLQKTDEEILGLSFVIEEGEIQESYLATQKDIDIEVLDYAKMLNQKISEHLKVIQSLSQKSGIGMVKNTVSINQVQNKNEKDLAALTPLQGAAFAQLYLSDIIKGHTEVLTWIDSQPVHNDEVKNYLRETRMNVSKNLDRAIILQKQQTMGQV